jgi:hypothetical protein
MGTGETVCRCISQIVERPDGIYQLGSPRGSISQDGTHWLDFIERDPLQQIFCWSGSSLTLWTNQKTHSQNGLDWLEHYE